MKGSPKTKLPTMLQLLKMKTMIPISKTLVKQASIYPGLRQLMLSIGQWEHGVLTRMKNPEIKGWKLILSGKSDVMKIDPVSEEQAVEYAGDLAGELFYYGAWTVGLGAWHLQMDKKIRESKRQSKEAEELARQSKEARERLENLRMQLKMFE